MNLFHFPRLISLIFCHLHVTNDILDLLRYHAPHLKSLNMSSHVSNKWNILLETILSLPVLHTCYLKLGISLCRIKSTILSKSSIKHLSLLGTNESCCINSLTSLLYYLPHLTSLHIQCNQLKCNEIIDDQYINRLLSLSSFSLTINHLPKLCIDFVYFISTIMPHLEQLKLKCSNPLNNLVYLNMYQWIKLLNSLPKLREVILIVTPKKKIKEKSWNNRCEQLTKFMNMKHITLQILQTKEHKK